jgi:hypothetical protein
LVFTVVAAGCGRIDFDPFSVAAPATCDVLAISDDFDDDAVAAQWARFAQSTVQVLETDHELEIVPAMKQDGSHFGGLISQAAFDMRDHCIFVTLVATPPDDGDVEMQLAVQVGNSTVGVSTVKGSLEAFQNLDGNVTTLGLRKHDPDAHHVVRLREEAGTVHWETSPDGATFVQQFEAPTPFDVSAAKPLLQAGTFGAVDNPGTAVFDDFDL